MEDFRFNHEELLQSIGLKTPDQKEGATSKAGPKILNTESERSPESRVSGFYSREEESAAKHTYVLDQRPLLFVFTIDLPGNQRTQLNVHKDDNPYLLARDICVQNNLNEMYIEPLAQSILANAKKVFEMRSPSSKWTTNNLLK